MPHAELRGEPCQGGLSVPRRSRSFRVPSGSSTCGRRQTPAARFRRSRVYLLDGATPRRLRLELPQRRHRLRCLTELPVLDPGTAAEPVEKDRRLSVAGIQPVPRAAHPVQRLSRSYPAPGEIGLEGRPQQQLRPPLRSPAIRHPRPFQHSHAGLARAQIPLTLAVHRSITSPKGLVRPNRSAY